MTVTAKPATRRNAAPSSLDRIAAWIFDLDNTLYPAECNLFAQIDARIGQFIANRLGLNPTAARLLQKQLFHRHGTTMRGLMLEHGVAPEPFLEYVHDIDFAPLPRRRALADALARLPGRKIVYTNASAVYAGRVLGELGVRRHFEAIFAIADADYVPKPDPRSYRRMIERHAIAPDTAAMIDDLPRNLEPAAGLGMTTVWVAGPARDGGPTPAYIHHVADDLLGWLEAINAAD